MRSQALRALAIGALLVPLASIAVEAQGRGPGAPRGPRAPRDSGEMRLGATQLLNARRELDLTSRQVVALDSIERVQYARRRQFAERMRASQDSFANYSDPSVNQPMYSGIDVLRIATLDSAKLYPAETQTNPLASEMQEAAGTGAEDIGPRLYMLNLNYLCPVFHVDRYMEKHEPLRHRDQPFTWVQYCDTWYQIVARSLQRHALVGPSGDMSAV